MLDEKHWEKVFPMEIENKKCNRRQAITSKRVRIMPFNEILDEKKSTSRSCDADLHELRRTREETCSPLNLLAVFFRNIFIAQDRQLICQWFNKIWELSQFMSDIRVYPELPSPFQTFRMTLAIVSRYFNFFVRPQNMPLIPRVLASHVRTIGGKTSAVDLTDL